MPLAPSVDSVGEEILEDDFLQPKELQDKNIEEIKKECEFDKIKDAFSDGAIALQLDFFYDCTENFKRACDLLSLNDGYIGFVDFFISTVYQYMLNLEIFFYQNFNINENVYSFFLAQQNEAKSIVPKRFSYSYNFEKYIQSDFPSFSIDDAEKHDLYSKYLFINLTTGQN